MAPSMSARAHCSNWGLSRLCTHRTETHAHTLTHSLIHIHAKTWHSSIPADTQLVTAVASTALAVAASSRLSNADARFLMRVEGGIRVHASRASLHGCDLVRQRTESRARFKEYTDALHPAPLLDKGTYTKLNS
eukprot:1150455-Pelagomonas_calceolata.AAC.4